MKKTIDINMAGLLLHLDEDAYRLLQRYLDALERHLGKSEGSDEILADVEARFAEIFQENMGSSRNVVNQKDVEAAIALLGRPEDFAGESAWDPEFERPEPADLGRERRFYRDDDNRVVGGVAAGIAAYFGWDPVLVRVAFVFITMVGMMGVPIYIVLWIVTPKAVTRAEKMAMRGEPVTVDNIRRKVEDEFHVVRDRMDSKDVSGRFKRGAGSFWDWFKEVFSKLLKVVLTLFALCLMLGMLGVGVAIFSAAFTGDLNWQGGWNDHNIAVMDLANLVLPSGYSMDYIMLASLLLILAPITFIVLLNLWVFLGMRWNGAAPKVLMFVSGIASLAGIIMLVVVGVRIGSEFVADNDHSQIARFELLEDQKEWQLKMKDLHMEGAHFEFRAEDMNGRTRITINDGVFHDDDDGDGFEGIELFYLDSGKVYLNHIDLDVRPTKETIPFVQVERESRGPNRRAAAYRAGRIEYDLEWSEDGLIQLNNLLNFPEKDRFRAQQVEVVLYLPVGHSVYLDYSTVNYLDDVKNQENMWDHHMGGRTWIMMPEGLTEVKPL